MYKTYERIKLHLIFFRLHLVKVGSLSWTSLSWTSLSWTSLSWTSCNLFGITAALDQEICPNQSPRRLWDLTNKIFILQRQQCVLLYSSIDRFHLFAWEMLNMCITLWQFAACIYKYVSLLWNTPTFNTTHVGDLRYDTLQKCI